MALGQSNVDEKGAKLRHRKSQKVSESDDFVWQCIAVLGVGRGSVADGVIDVSYQLLIGFERRKTSQFDIKNWSSEAIILGISC